jgi:hypothetical protein
MDMHKAGPSVKPQKGRASPKPFVLSLSKDEVHAKPVIE